MKNGKISTSEALKNGKTSICTISLIYSFLYGFAILLILDMVNHKVNFSPIFRSPSTIGILRGVVSFLFYILVMVVVKRNYKSMGVKEYLLYQIIVFIFGLISFWSVGAVLFTETPNCC
jgi:hypothetical protein